MVECLLPYTTQTLYQSTIVPLCLYDTRVSSMPLAWTSNLQIDLFPSPMVLIRVRRFNHDGEMTSSTINVNDWPKTLCDKASQRTVFLHPETLNEILSSIFNFYSHCSMVFSHRKSQRERLVHTKSMEHGSQWSNNDAPTQCQEVF